ncbi:MAG: hypothetical protein OEZ55_08505 [Nitrospinota bacterium]|nr:hypothetical protein [Nitrospinota bacterium]
MVGENIKHTLIIALAMAALVAPAIFNACTSKTDDSGQVTGLVVTPGDGRNTLKWNPAKGATAYDIIWRVNTGSGARNGLDGLLDTSPTSESHVVSNVSRNSYVHHGLMNGWNYSYLVVPAGFDHSLLSPSVGGVPGVQLNCIFEGQTNCSGNCMFLETNNSNCGACGNACSATSSCIGGSCEEAPSCPADYPDNCAPASSDALMCVDLQFDSENCGACGNVCEAGLECSYGFCERPGVCPDPEWVDCLGNGQQPPGWFVCSLLRSSVQDCGACGNRCWVGETCHEGMCVPEDTAGAGCDGGQTKCGDACVDITSNTDNCGACGNACSAVQQCVEGVCFTPPSCPVGQTLCGNSCKDTNTDPKNCGACGNSCANIGNNICAGGACVP